MSFIRFNINPQSIAQRVRGGYRAKAAKIVMAIFDEFLAATPVKTGRLVRNWKVIGESGELPAVVEPIAAGAEGEGRRGPNASAARAEALAVVAVSTISGKGRLSIVNTTPYASKVNYGNITSGSFLFMDSALIRAKLRMNAL